MEVQVCGTARSLADCVWLACNVECLMEFESLLGAGVCRLRIALEVPQEGDGDTGGLKISQKMQQEGGLGQSLRRTCHIRLLCVVGNGLVCTL